MKRTGLLTTGLPLMAISASGCVLDSVVGDYLQDPVAFVGDTDVFEPDITPSGSVDLEIGEAPIPGDLSDDDFENQAGDHEYTHSPSPFGSSPGVKLVDVVFIVDGSAGARDARVALADAVAPLIVLPPDGPMLDVRVGVVSAASADAAVQAQWVEVGAHGLADDAAWVHDEILATEAMFGDARPVQTLTLLLSDDDAIRSGADVVVVMLHDSIPPDVMVDVEPAAAQATVHVIADINGECDVGIPWNLVELSVVTGGLRHSVCAGGFTSFVTAVAVDAMR